LSEAELDILQKACFIENDSVLLLGILMALLPLGEIQRLINAGTTDPFLPESAAAGAGVGPPDTCEHPNLTRIYSTSGKIPNHITKLITGMILGSTEPDELDREEVFFRCLDDQSNGYFKDHPNVTFQEAAMVWARGSSDLAHIQYLRGRALGELEVPYPGSTVPTVLASPYLATGFLTRTETLICLLLGYMLILSLSLSLMNWRK
jgi:hypothetical protein